MVADKERKPAVSVGKLLSLENMKTVIDEMAVFFMLFFLGDALLGMIKKLRE
jgi:hypothetical protein